jgi:hypothetical protein
MVCGALATAPGKGQVVREAEAVNVPYEVAAVTNHP